MNFRKILALTLALVMVLGTMGTVAFAADVTDGYEAQNGDVLTGGTGTEIITVADDAEITLSGVNVQRITLKGDAIINLADGTTNDVNANGLKDGAVVVPKGGSLVINGDTGVLNAAKCSSGSWSAAIGSDRWGTPGNVTITINGGVINAAANYAAAIGGGQENSATVIINGGTINAKSGYGAAIGGGQEADATVTITGGTVDAISSWGAAIGGGQEADANITISGGIVSAQGLFGAAIGAGTESTGTTTISIANAEVTATVDPATHTSNPSSTRGITSAAIGASEGKAEITITDSVVNATSVNAPAIGGGLNSVETSTVVISGASNVAVMASAPDFEIENSIGNATGSEGVTVDDTATVEEVVPVAQLKDGRFASLQAALDAVEAGNNEIILLADCDEDVIVSQQDGINIVLNGNDQEYSGTITIHGNNRNKGEETLTIKDFNFTTSEADHDFIWNHDGKNGTVRYAHNITVQDCDFTATGDGLYTAVGLRISQAYNINVIGCTATGMHSLMWATSIDNPLNVDGVTVTDSKNGIAFGTTKKAILKNSNITATDGYAVRADAEVAGYSLVIEDCALEATYPVIVRNAKQSDYNLNVGEGSVLTATNAEGYDIVVTSGKDDQPFVKPANDINITIAEDVEANVFSSHVAIIGDTYYNTLADAVAVGGNITLLADASLESANIKKDTTIDLNENTLIVDAVGISDSAAGNMAAIQAWADVKIMNGNIVASAAERISNGIFYVGNKDYASLTIEDVNLTATNTNGTDVFVTCNPGTLSIIDSTINASGVSKLVNGGDGGNATITRSEINVSDSDRVMVNIALTADESDFVVSNLSDNAFRNVSGTINNTNIDAHGYASGIKNDAGRALAITGNSVVTLTGAAEGEYDLYLKGDATLTIAETATFEADDVLVEGENAVTGNVVSKAESVYVQYKKVDSEEGTDKYEIVLVGANAEKINELASADLTFDFEGTLLNGAAMDYAVEAANGVSLTKLGDRYLFNYNGVDKYEESGLAIVIGTITIEGYGSYTLKTDEQAKNAVYATEIRDNIVDGFEDAATLIINAEIADDDDMVGKVEDAVIAVPVRDLAIDIAFKNAVENQSKAYQDMKVVISGGDLAENIEIELGSDAQEVLDLAGKADAAVDVNYANNAYTVAVTDALTYNRAYTVTVSGAGYRTARYTVTMTDDKALSFWNNVMDNNTAVEEGEFETTKTFLAGDIVKDNNINIYDLSAVVSYFGTDGINTQDVSDYAKYDLNRDGVIDSKDVAYVLVSWGE